MDVAAVDNMNIIKVLFEKQDSTSGDLFSELLAALFSNFQVLPQQGQFNLLDSENQNANYSNNNDISNVNSLNDIIALVNQLRLEQINLNVSKTAKGELEQIIKDLSGENNGIKKELYMLLEDIESNSDIPDEGKVKISDIVKLLNTETEKKHDNQVFYGIKNAKDDIKTKVTGNLNEGFKKTEDSDFKVSNVKPTKYADSQQNIENEVNKIKMKEPGNIKVEPEQMQSLNTSHKTHNTIKAEENNTPLIKNQDDLVEVVVEKFKALRLPETTELRVKLKPEELGEITVKVVLEKGQINGSITADKKDVVNMLQNQIDSLKTELKNNNINLNHISVNVGSDESYRDQQSRQFAHDNKNRNKQYAEFFEEQKSEVSEEGFNIIA